MWPSNTTVTFLGNRYLKKGVRDYVSVLKYVCVAKVPKTNIKGRFDRESKLVVSHKS